jgi:crotonobetaine/carnitine-CoA ligase
MNLSYRALAGFEATSDHSYRLFGTGMCDTPLDKRYGVKTVGWWGMTETVSHPVVGSPHFPDRPMSMGRPAPEYAVRVVQDDLVTLVEPEGTGHLLVRGIRGLSLFSAYLNNPEATEDSFDEMGWFRTGDLVTVHPDGYLTFADRAKDMLRVGGENVAASEIERVLLETGRVSEAAVVGAPDEKLDEVPVAFVVPRETSPDLETVLLTACRERLADFKVPRQVFPVRDLPRVNIGKVNKVALRHLVAAPDDIAAAEEQWVLDND